MEIIVYTSPWLGGTFLVLIDYNGGHIVLKEV